VGRNCAMALRSAAMSSGGRSIVGAGWNNSPGSRSVVPYTISAGARPMSVLTVLRKARSTSGNLVLQ